MLPNNVKELLRHGHSLSRYNGVIGCSGSSSATSSITNDFDWSSSAASLTIHIDNFGTLIGGVFENDCWGQVNANGSLPFGRTSPSRTWSLSKKGSPRSPTVLLRIIGRCQMVRPALSSLGHPVYQFGEPPCTPFATSWFRSLRLKSSSGSKANNRALESWLG